METPYYKGVPKDIEANLKWRAEVLERAGKDPQYAATLKQMCADDVLFYINVFCWIKEPRDMKDPIKPFITYDYQDDSILEECDAIEQGLSVAWPKTRAMGATWMAICIYDWFLKFRKNLDFGMVSQKEDLVDKRGDTSSLFGKFDFLWKYQPEWLKPSITRRHCFIKNNDNNTTIVGESTTENMFRSQRKTAVFVDEFAAFPVADSFSVLKALFSVTNSVLYCSTPQGTGNGFWRIVFKTAAIKRYLHFSQHPIFSKGLYTTDEKGKLKHLDDFKGKVKIRRIDWSGYKEFDFPGNYPFILDGKMRSPWYDDVEAETGSKQTMAQEVEINFQGSAHQFFDADFINKLIAEYCIDPIEEGMIDVNDTENNDANPGDFARLEEGPLKLWFHLGDNNGRDFIKDKKFGIGGDVSAGTGASNSSATVVDLATGKKVALWKDPNTFPKEYAEISIAMCKWFNNAKLIWDASGSIGQTYSTRIAQLHYANLYYHKDEVDPGKRVSDKPGYFLNPTLRGVLLREYRSALSLREFINVSKSGMDETLQFIEEPGGKAVHSAAKNNEDPSGAKEAHGDECIGDALAAKLRTIILKNREKKEEDVEFNPYCLAARIANWEREQVEAKLEYW